MLFFHGLTDLSPPIGHLKCQLSRPINSIGLMSDLAAIDRIVASPRLGDAVATQEFVVDCLNRHAASSLDLGVL